MDFNTVTGIILQIAIWSLVAAVVGAILFGLYKWANQWKKYKQFDVTIYKKDNFGNIREVSDNGGIFIDQYTGNKRFYLLKHKGASVDADKLKPVPQLGKKRDKIYLFQVGQKNMSVLNMRIDPNDQFKVKVSEQGVNWGLQEYQKQKARYNKKSFWEENKGIITFMFFAILILIILVMFLKEIGGQLPQMLNQLKDIASVMEEAAKNIASAKTGTVVQ